MKRFLLLFVLIIIDQSYAQHWDDEISEFDSYRKECLKYQARITEYKIDCLYNFHHFNLPKRSPKSKKKEIIISEFNVLHPGMKKSWLKDFDLLAQIINKSDLVAVTELIPLTNKDRKFNEELEKFISDTPKKIKKLEQDIIIEATKMKPNESKIHAINSAISELNLKLKEAPNLFIRPGYLQILDALNKRYQNRWSLVLSPRGEARNKTDTFEHVGFFYRNDRIALTPNTFCTEIKTLGHEETEACLVPMGPAFMGIDYREVFSRRPFMASFKMRDFSFNILSSHIVYNSPQDEEERNKILSLIFGTTNISGITGLNNENYARQAEVKITLDFINRTRDTLLMKNTLWAGDFNLETSNLFFKQLVSESNHLLQIDEPTTLANKKIYNDGTPSQGKASNYDHFVFHKSDFKNCFKEDGRFRGSVYYFHENKFQRKIKNKYQKKVEPDVPTFSTFKNMSFRYNKGAIIVRTLASDEKLLEEYRQDYTSKLIESQEENDQYYSLYRNTISDHFPITMKCSL